MEPGILTDSLIARKIWRAVVVSDSGENYMVAQSNHEKVPVPSFSTDMMEARKIVEFFENKGWTFRVRSVSENDNFQACFFKDDNRIYKFSKADTMPMAICKAAMAVINGTNIK